MQAWANTIAPAAGLVGRERGELRHGIRLCAGAAAGVGAQRLSTIGLYRSASAILGRTLRRDFLRLRRRNHLRSRRDYDVGTRLRQVRTLVGLRLFYRRRRVDHIWLGERYRLVGLHRVWSVPSSITPQAASPGGVTRWDRGQIVVAIERRRSSRRRTCSAQAPLPVRYCPAPMSNPADR